jgi:hypothetical protein
MENVEQGILWGLIPGILCGTYFGGNFAYLFSDNILRLIFAIVILWMGLRYIKAPLPD